MITKNTILYKMMALPGLGLIYSFETLIKATSQNTPFFDAEKFPWAREVEAAYPEIKRELLAVLAEPEAIPEFKNVSEEQERISKGRAWRTFIFQIYGHQYEANCARCPNTVAALQKIPGLKTAMFSIFEPGTHLSPHRGPFKGVLRYHLALKVPKDPMSCGITVGGETRHWEEGKSLVFDDTFEHEAWNRSDETRVVLFVDFLRELPFPVSSLNQGMISLIGASPFIQNMVTKLNQWSQRVADVQLPGAAPDADAKPQSKDGAA